MKHSIQLSAIAIVAFVSLAGSSLGADIVPSNNKNAGTTAAPPLDSAIANWRSKRFGMFIHWGPVSLTAKEIGWSRGAPTPIQEYDNLYKRFNPSKFNADQWVFIAKAAGMKYIVLTTKHHDGFCLWDTKLHRLQYHSHAIQARRGKGVVGCLQKTGDRVRGVLLGD